MNEFTKEELEQILFDMDEKTWSLGDDFVSIEYRQLRDKVSRLIEIYNTPQAIREHPEQHGGCF